MGLGTKAACPFADMKQVAAFYREGASKALHSIFLKSPKTP
jgi:hypothetical protein